MEGKKTRGKQRIELKLIKNVEDKFITFSKRRLGIYKKLIELVTLTGAEVAFVVFSPAGKPYSFGHPSVESVVRRYQGQEKQDPDDASEQIFEAHRRIKINDLTNHYNKLIEKLNTDNQKMKALKASIDATEGEHVEGWWETPIEDLSFGDLVEINNSYKEIFAMISTKDQEKTAHGASTSLVHLNSNLNPNPLHLGTIVHDHLGIAQMFGPWFEVGSGSGGGAPSFEVGNRSGRGGPSFEAGSGDGGPPFQAVDGSGGSGPPVAGRHAPTDVGHQ